MKAMGHYLGQTLAPEKEVRAQAVQFLQSNEAAPGYAILLMAATHAEGVEMHKRQAAALTFKNFIKKHWPASDDGTASKISAADRVKIKANIIDLMVKLPDNLQKQVSEAVSEIGKVDFPAQQWPELLPNIVAKFATGDFNIINGVLRAAHPLFKRYRFESRSDALWTEIAYVLGQLVEPLTQLFTATIQLTAAHQAN